MGARGRGGGRGAASRPPPCPALSPLPEQAPTAPAAGLGSGAATESCRERRPAAAPAVVQGGVPSGCPRPVGSGGGRLVSAGLRPTSPGSRPVGAGPRATTMPSRPRWRLAGQDGKILGRGLGRRLPGAGPPRRALLARFAPPQTGAGREPGGRGVGKGRRLAPTHRLWGKAWVGGWERFPPRAQGAAQLTRTLGAREAKWMSWCGAAKASEQHSPKATVKKTTKEARGPACSLSQSSQARLCAWHTAGARRHARRGAIGQDKLPWGGRACSSRRSQWKRAHMPRLARNRHGCLQFPPTA